MKICRIFTWTVDIENPLAEFEDIHQEIFLAKFHGNLTLPGLGDLREKTFKRA